MFISSFVVLQAENHLNEDFPPLSLQSKVLQSCSCAVEFTTRPSQHSPKVTLLHRQFFPFFLTKSFRGFSSTIDWSLMTFKKTTNQTAGDIEGKFPDFKKLISLQCRFFPKVQLPFLLSFFGACMPFYFIYSLSLDIILFCLFCIFEWSRNISPLQFSFKDPLIRRNNNSLTQVCENLIYRCWVGRGKNQETLSLKKCAEKYYHQQRS